MPRDRRRLATLGDCEAMAERASSESTLDRRQRADPRLLAVGYLRLRLRPVAGAQPELRRDVIVFDAAARESERAWQIARVCGRWLLHDEGWKADEIAEMRIARALLLPGRAYLRDVRRVAGDLERFHAACVDVRSVIDHLEELGSLWPLAPLAVHALRIGDLAELARAGRVAA